MRFWKGHALGNDYVVVEARSGPPGPAGDPGALEPAVVRGLCDRHRGVGADGVLLCDTRADPVSLRIFNPDGGEAEKSGNGLRILGAWLHDRGLAAGTPFRVALPAETVTMVVEGGAGAGAGGDRTRTVRVDMGVASFDPDDVGYGGPVGGGEVMGDPLDVDGEAVPVHLVSLGNPHCVVFPDVLDIDGFRRLAPRLQALPAFERGVNVQFARAVGPGRLDVLIWERGAGETLASGSSACAVAAAAVRSGRATGPSFVVAMQGGEVAVEIDAAWRVRLTGPAQIVFEGTVSDGVVAGWSS